MNVHALGDNWIEKVTRVRQPEESDAISEDLQFLALVRGWETITRQARCRALLDIEFHCSRRRMATQLQLSSSDLPCCHTC